MKLSNSKLLNISVACFATTILYTVPVISNAETVVSSSTIETKDSYTRPYTHVVKTSGFKAPPDTYYYSNNGYSGTLFINEFAYDKKLDISTAIYKGYISCSGTCAIPSLVESEN